MDSATLAGWLVALVASVTLILMMRYRSQDIGAQRMAELLKPINETLAQHKKWHGEHYDAAKAHATGLAKLGQQMNDHEDRDNERFQADGEMLREIRDDIKELLKRQ